jgi:hypothetical protein
MAALGYGHHSWDLEQATIEYLLLLSAISGTFSILGAVWSKTSFGVTLLQITEGWYNKLTWFCIVSMNIAMILSTIFLWTRCTPTRRAWDVDSEGTCWNPKVTVYYSIFSGAYSGLMDFALALLPWRYLWDLQMKRKEKLGVGFAMSMGVFAGVTAVVKASKIIKMLSPDIGRPSVSYLNDPSEH